MTARLEIERTNMALLYNKAQNQHFGHLTVPEWTINSSVYQCEPVCPTAKALTMNRTMIQAQQQISNRTAEKEKYQSTAELRELCMDKCCTRQWTEATLWRPVDQKSSTIMQQTHRATLYFYFRLLVLKQVLWAQLFTALQTYRLLYLDLCVLLKGQQEEKNEC